MQSLQLFHPSAWSESAFLHPDGSWQVSYGVALLLEYLWVFVLKLSCMEQGQIPFIVY